jgi:aarF domain-containing kinase
VAKKYRPHFQIGVESRLASLTLDAEEFDRAKGLLDSVGDAPQSGFSTLGARSMGAEDFLSVVSAMPVFFNMLFIRRAVIPAANGHFSARALARYYAVLGTSADSDALVYTSSSNPPLGSHPQIPSLKHKKDANTQQQQQQQQQQQHRKREQKADKDDSSSREGSAEMHAKTNGSKSSHPPKKKKKQLFKDPEIHDAFLGTGKYGEFAHGDGPFGLGFRRYTLMREEEAHDRYIAFGHSGVGGCTAFCSPKHKFALAITVNKLSRGGITAKIVKFICEELNFPCPDQYAEHSMMMGPDMSLGMKAPMSESG